MQLSEIIVDKPIEVSEAKYKSAMTNLAGVVAGQEKDGKFYVKLWNGHTVYKKRLLSILNS